MCNLCVIKRGRGRYNAFASLAIAPSGNPTTTQVNTPEPERLSVTRLAQLLFTQQDYILVKLFAIIKDYYSL